MLFEDILIECVPAIRLLYMQLKTGSKELSEEQKKSMLSKLKRLVFDKILKDLCRRRQVGTHTSVENFMQWLN